MRGQDLAASSKGEWEQALKLATASKQSLTILLRQAAQWGWLSETEDLLWTIVNRYPNEKWAVDALTQALYAGARTRSLMSLFSLELKNDPSNLIAKNDLATTALLLEAKELNPHELAREVYSKAPTNAEFASTYAFSLFIQKKNAEALKIIEQISPRARERPSIAGYYGLILKAAGNPAKAKTYLNISLKAHLLPEERQLFEKAKAG